MKKIILKAKNKVKLDKELSIFLFVLLIIGILSGSIFAGILNNSDKILVTNHLNTFLTNIEENKLIFLDSFKNNLISSFSNTLMIWLLGISVIGLPIIIMIYFYKSFIIGFTVGCILSTFKFKGILFAFIYIFPEEIIYILTLVILVMYSMSFSFKLIYSVFKKKTLDFKIMINKYLIILGIAIISNLITSLYSSYLMPNIIKSLITFIR